jgi:hypothetical protein
LREDVAQDEVVLDGVHDGERAGGGIFVAAAASFVATINTVSCSVSVDVEKRNLT